MMSHGFLAMTPREKQALFHGCFFACVMAEDFAERALDAHVYLNACDNTTRFIALLLLTIAEGEI